LRIPRRLSRPPKLLAVVALLALTLPPVAGAGAGTLALQGARDQHSSATRKAKRTRAALRAARNGSAATGVLVAHHARHHAQSQTQPSAHNQAAPTSPKTGPTTTGSTAPKHGRIRARRQRWRSRVRAGDVRAHHQIRAHAAGDPSDTISDFKFTPASITIHVGDTVTWVNNGPSEHTATANDQSFDTGLLKKGASASHTFTQAGTFTYICTIHPFMHGTVVVLANAASNTPPASSNNSNTTTTTPSSTTTTPSSATTTAQPAATAASTGSTLPDTGIDALLIFGIGIAMGCIGIALRGTFRRGHS
jgi:plastocyanin